MVPYTLTLRLYARILQLEDSLNARNCPASVHLQHEVQLTVPTRISLAHRTIRPTFSLNSPNGDLPGDTDASLHLKAHVKPSW
jgi:hypothetical protein